MCRRLDRTVLFRALKRTPQGARLAGLSSGHRGAAEVERLLECLKEQSSHDCQGDAKGAGGTVYAAGCCSIRCPGAPLAPQGWCRLSNGSNSAKGNEGKLSWRLLVLVGLSLR